MTAKRASDQHNAIFSSSKTALHEHVRKLSVHISLQPTTTLTLITRLWVQCRRLIDEKTMRNASKHARYVHN